MKKKVLETLDRLTDAIFAHKPEKKSKKTKRERQDPSNSSNPPNSKKS